MFVFPSIKGSALLAFASMHMLATVAASEWSKICGNPTREYSLRLSAGYGAPDGFERSLLLVNGQTPGPLVEANQGETLAVNVVNELATQVGMHWHGLHQRGTPEYDGVPGVNQYAIPPGGNLTYCFSTDTNYGAYWYHVHLRDLYQDGIRGPLLIHPRDNVERPYHLISNNSDELGAMQDAEKASRTLVINDWFHETSDEIALRLVATNDSMRPLCASSVLFDGMGSVQCPARVAGLDSFGCVSMEAMTASSGSGDGMASMGHMSMDSTTASASATESMSSMNSMAMSGMGSRAMSDMGSTAMSSMGGMGVPSNSAASAMSGMSMTNPTSTSSASSPMVSGTTAPGLADQTCQNTSAPLFMLNMFDNTTWFMLHLINAGASQQLAFSIDEHDLWVVSADGSYIVPHKVQALDIGIGQRYGIMVKRPQPAKAAYTMRASTMTHQTYQGTAVLSYGNATSDSMQPSSTPWIGTDGMPQGNASVKLDESSLAPFMATNLTEASMEIRLEVNQSQPTVWVLEQGQPFGSNSGQTVPLLFEPRNASGVFSLSRETTVDLVLQIAADSLDDMAHPIHLHGHYFRVLGSMANSIFPTNMTVAEVANTMADSPIGMSLDLTASAPMRDSAHLPEGGWLALRFVADNPGVWLLHCHINSHLSSGMAVAFIELADQFPTFPASITTSPQVAPLQGISEFQ